MRRVYAIYAFRKLSSPRGIKLLIIGLFLAEISPFSPYLSLRHIIANMPHLTDPKALYTFHTSAFMHTQLIVQISLIAVAIVLASYFYALLRYFTSHLPYINRREKLAH